MTAREGIYPQLTLPGAQRGVRMDKPSEPSGADASETTTEYVPKPKGRTWLLAVVLLILGLLIGGGLGYTLAPAPAPAVPKVKVIGPWTGAEQAAFLPVLDLFARTTGIPYEYAVARQEELQTSLPLEFQGRRAPADLIFMSVSFIRQYGRDGHAADLSSNVPNSNYPTGFLDPLKIDGKLYPVPWTGKLKPGFWYNKSFFAEHSLAPPETFAEFQALLAAIKAVPGIRQPIISGEDRGVAWPLSDVTEHFIATYGGPQMHRDLTSGALAWTDQSVKDVFRNFLVPTLQAGHWSAPRQWDLGVREWWNGDFGLYFMGSWITSMVEAIEAGGSGDMGVFALPPPTGSSEVLVFANDWFFVPAYAPNPAAARQLAAFLAGPAAQNMQVKQGGHIATALGVPATAYPVTDATIRELLEGKQVLPDLDDTVGGTFQTEFWSQLKALWANPSQLDTVLAAIQTARTP